MKNNVTTTPMPGDFHEAGAAQTGAKTQSTTTPDPLASAEQAADPLDVVGLLVDQIKSLSAEIERGKIAREQWADDDTALAEAIVENSKLTNRVKELKQQIRQEIANRNNIADELAVEREARTMGRKASRDTWKNFTADELRERVAELYRVIDRQQAAIKDGIVERDKLCAKIAELEKLRANDPDLKKSWHDLKAVEDERDKLRAQVDDLTRKLRDAKLAVEAAVEVDKLHLEDIANLRCNVKTQRETINTQAVRLYHLLEENDQLKSRRYPMASSYPPDIKNVDINSVPRVKYECQKCGTKYDIFPWNSPPKNCSSCGWRVIIRAQE